MKGLQQLQLHKAWAVGAAVLSLGLLLTTLSAHWLQLREQHDAQLRFERHASRLESAILQRFDQPLAAFTGMRSFFEAAHWAVTRDTFQSWVESRDLSTEVPGVRGIGYIERVQRKDIDTFITRERADAAPGFSIKTQGQAPDLYIIKYIEPLDRNGAAWGYDLGSEAVRRETMERAVARGEPSLSGAITLVQDEKKRAGFIYALPIYRSQAGSRPSTPQARQSGLLGLVYSPIVLEELLANVDAAADAMLDFEVFDRTDAAPLIDHDTKRTCDSLNLVRNTPDCEVRRYHATRKLSIGGRTLHVLFSGTPAFDSTVDRSVPRTVVTLGCLVSVLLAALAWQLASSRERAQALADRMTEQVQRNAKRFELAIEGGNDGLWEWINVHGHEQWWSPHFYRLLGYEPGELSANLVTFDELLHPEHRPATFAALEAALSGEREFDVEYQLRTRSGEYRWFHARAKVYRDAQGEPTSMSGSLQDIHDQRLAQERVYQRGEQLAALFALSPDGFVALGPDAMVSMVSPAFTRLTGIPAHEVLGQDSAHLLNRLRARCEALAHAQDLASALKPAGQGSKKRVVLEFAGPPRRMLQAALLAGEGDEVSQLLYFRDITHESEVEHLKTEFLTMAAHELRTPMASIFGFTEMLMVREFPPEKRKNILERMHNNGKTMIALIDELLDVSRIEARAGADLDVITVDLCEVARDAVFEFKVPEGREPPELTLAAHPLRVRADPAALRQAMHNLLSNAYKYSPSGGPVRITSAHRDYGGVEQHGLHVIDQGIGLSPADLARVGERFFRADKSGNKLGAGLGVSIVKQTIELLGGRFEIASREGEGTQASIWLSALAEQAHASGGELELMQ